MRLHNGLIALFLLALLGCQTTAKQRVKIRVASRPADALVSVHTTADPDLDDFRMVAGSTPLEKALDFGDHSTLWLEIEKRGYMPRIIAITAEQKSVSVHLQSCTDAEGNSIAPFAFPSISQMLVYPPRIDVKDRGFASETLNAEDSTLAAQAVVDAIDHALTVNQIKRVAPTLDGHRQADQALWREAKTAMQLVDPIRLPYQQHPATLESRFSRDAAHSLAARYSTDVALFVIGRQNRETAGMTAGKIGMTAAGTAASYGQAYSNALAHSDSLYAYTIYIPQFAEGTYLAAALVDLKRGELLWINKGHWGPLDWQNHDIVAQVVKDLLARLPYAQ
jgi:hypothetical protein